MIELILKNPIPNSIKNVIGDKKSIAIIENQARAEILHQINQGRPAVLAKLFSPDELKALQDRIDQRDKAANDM